MAKYSFKFKLKIVQEYLEGNGGAPYLKELRKLRKQEAQQR